MVSAQQNMDLQTTILSRFDLIFIVRDVTTREHDVRLADHMCLMHRLGHVSNQQEDRDEQVCTPLLTTYSSQACHDQLPHCNLHQLHLGKYLCAHLLLSQRSVTLFGVQLGACLCFSSFFFFLFPF